MLVYSPPSKMSAVSRSLASGRNAPRPWSPSRYLVTSAAMGGMIRPARKASPRSRMSWSHHGGLQSCGVGPPSLPRQPRAPRNLVGAGGAPGRIRTCDLPLRRRLLCPLSYGDAAASLARPAPTIGPWWPNSAVRHSRVPCADRDRRRVSREHGTAHVGTSARATAAGQLALELPLELPALAIAPEWKDQQRLWGHAFHPMCSYLASFPAALAHAFIARYIAAGRRRPRPVLRPRHDAPAGVRRGADRRRQRPQPVRPPPDRGQGRARRRAPRLDTGWPSSARLDASGAGWLDAGAA